MSSHPINDRWLKLRGLTSTSDAEGVPVNNQRLLISDVREALGLDDLPHRRFLNSECWLAGGSILRWLSGELDTGGASGWDFDFFYPSRDSLIRSALSFLSAGYTFSRYSIKGTPWDKITKRLWPPVPPFERWDEGDGYKCFSDICSRTDLLVVELISPEGVLLQLAGLQTYPTIDELLAKFDFSVCQFGIDDQYIYSGPHAWNDLMAKRLRLHRMGYPPLAFKRLLKFSLRGYHPDFHTISSVTNAFLRGRWRWPTD